MDTVGRGVPLAHTATQPLPVAPVTVTLTTTADTPVAGTGPRPVTWTVTVPALGTAPAGAPTPDRVSSIRVGGTEPTAPGVVGAVTAFGGVAAEATGPLGVAGPSAAAPALGWAPRTRRPTRTGAMARPVRSARSHMARHPPFGTIRASPA